MRRIVEIGCGAGWFLDEAYKMGIDVTGYDTNLDCVKYAQHNLGIDIRAEYFTDALQEKCDVIAAISVLEHMESPGELMKEIAATAIRNGALALISVPTHLKQVFTFLGDTSEENTANPLRLYPWHVTHFSRNGLENFVKRFGAIKVERLHNGLWDGVLCSF